jgi:hypothetical protein
LNKNNFFPAFGNTNPVQYACGHCRELDCQPGDTGIQVSGSPHVKHACKPGKKINGNPAGFHAKTYFCATNN